MDKNEKRICWYSSLLIVFMVNTPKLLALRENGIIARYWHFNLGELLFQETYTLAFCWLVFYLNLQPSCLLASYQSHKKYWAYWLTSLTTLMLAVLIGAFTQSKLFPTHKLPQIFLLGTFARLGLSGVLILILTRIILLIREAKERDLAHEHLKNAYIVAELELLKQQVNPHFLFNALSSLSGVIREDPELAQKYLRDLSNVFRYAFTHARANLVTVEDELTMLRSFEQLIKMRLEGAFDLTVSIDASYLGRKLPPISLQPLLENAVKHNAATLDNPLKVTIFTQGNYLVISNVIAEIPLPESSNGFGLVNLNERYKIMVQQEIEITQNNGTFIVKLPLKA